MLNCELSGGVAQAVRMGGLGMLPLSHNSEFTIYPPVIFRTVRVAVPTSLPSTEILTRIR
jgi:hypothetical protein